MAEWKTIKNFPNYEVSDDGRVRSVGGWRNFGWTKRFSPSTERKLAQKPNGYLQVTIYDGRGSRNHYVHRLVADAFVCGKTRHRNNINHKNGIKSDNMADNLEWTTVSENHLHARRILKKSWSTKRVLSWDDVCEVRLSNESNSILAEKYGVSPVSISGIRSMRRRLRK